MARREHDYREEAQSDALEMVAEFEDQIISQAVGNRGDREMISDDILNDYAGGDSYHHETHGDRSYNLQEAAELLDQLRDHEEDDEGLWQGASPRDAISIQAACTYANAVRSYWADLIEELNDDIDPFSDMGDEEWEEFLGRFVPAWVWLKQDADERWRDMKSAVWTALQQGDFTGLQILADKIQELEGERSTTPARLRKWATSTYVPDPEEEDDDDDAGEPDPADATDLHEEAGHG